MVERAFKGESESFPINSSNISTDKAETKTNIHDLFGLKSKLSGELFNLNIDLVSKYNSLNNDRFPKDFKAIGNISKI